MILYEIHDIGRFPRVGNFISYARLVKCAHESAGKRMKAKNTKIGNVHLKWAFSEAACLFLRGNPRAKLYHQRLLSRYGKAKELSIIAQKLGRTVYNILKRRTPYDARRFFETPSIPPWCTPARSWTALRGCTGCITRERTNCIERMYE